MQVHPASLTRQWMFLGVTALALAGVFAILLVAARTPIVQDYLPFHDLFHTALVVHVDLSVLVWLLAMAAMLCRADKIGTFAPSLAWLLAWPGMILMAVAPFVGDPEPVINNYVPMLDSKLFSIGLGMFTFSISWTLVLNLRGLFKSGNVFRYGAAVTAWIFIIALLCVYLAYGQLKPIRDSFYAVDYYELLYWGGGHVLQIAYANLILVAWCALLISEEISKNIDTKKPIFLLMMFHLIIALPLPLVYFYADITSYEAKHYFTLHMMMLTGIPTGLFAIWLWFRWIGRFFRLGNAIETTLWMSLLLYTAGGVIGLLKEEENAMVPAHYHGSIVGVSLAWMGVCYYLLPMLGYANVRKWKMAKWQPIFYGGGQLLHIIGLAVSGGYGAMRKAPGEVADPTAQAMMGLMGLGGLLSIIGGLLFVLVIIKAVRKKLGKVRHTVILN